MSISSTSRKTAPLAGNGAQTVFPFTFKVQFSGDIVVYTRTAGVETTVNSNDYTVALNANQNVSPGGSVTFDTAPATGTSVTITTNALATQNTNLQNQGAYNPVVINEAFDKLTIQIQQLQERANRALTLPVTDGQSGALPAAAARAGKALLFNVDGSPKVDFVSTGGGGGGGDVTAQDLIDAIAAHVALADPHTQYQLEADLEDDVNNTLIPSFNIAKFQSLKDRFAIRIDPTTVGCKNDGSNINSALEDLEAWLQANPMEPTDPNFPVSRTIIWPDGRFRIHKKLTFLNGESMQGSSTGSTYLKFVTPGEGGLLFDQRGYAYESTTTVRDLRLLAECQGAGPRPLEIIHRPTLSTWWNRMNVENVQADGNIFGNYWVNGMRFMEAWNSNFRRLQMTGRNTFDWTDWPAVAYEFGGDTVSGINLNQVKAQSCFTGVKYSMDHLEGADHTDCAIVSCRDGFDFTNDTGGGPLHINMRTIHVAQSTHTNAATPGSCIKIKQGHSCNISHSELYVDGQASGSNGILLEDCATVSIDQTNKIVNVGYSIPNTNATGINMINPYRTSIGAMEFGFFRGTGVAPVKMSGNAAVACDIQPTRAYQCNEMVNVNQAGVHLEMVGGKFNTSDWNNGASVVRPNQTRFFARYSSSAASVFGDSINYTALFPSVTQNVGSAFNGSTGLYTHRTEDGDCDVEFEACITFSGAGSAHTFGYFQFVDSNGTIWQHEFEPFKSAAANGQFTFTARCVAAMTPGRTMKVNLNTESPGFNLRNMGVLGHASINYSWFRGRVVS